MHLQGAHPTARHLDAVSVERFNEHNPTLGQMFPPKSLTIQPMRILKTGYLILLERATFPRESGQLDSIPLQTKS